MYNRYIPQPDGSYKKSRMAEPVSAPPKPKPPAPHKQPAPPCAPECTEVPPCPPAPAEPPHHSCPKKQPGNQAGIGNFFKNLLPKELDTADLLILLLLLLMAGDCEEDKNSALLTMALYFLL